jgi:hypothetical protein
MGTQVKEVEVIDRIEGIFAYSMFDDHLQRFIGFDKMSRFREDGDTGWYFWLSGKQGVYELQRVSWGSKFACPYTQFILRYYPHPEEPVFEDFSFFEQVVRLGDSFTHGCPKFGSRKQLHESCYVIGDISIFLRNKAILAIVRSQNRWIVHRPQGLEMENPTGGKKLVAEKGEKDRNVSGWGLSWYNFDCLVKAFCCINRTSPSLVRLKSCPGKIWYVNGESEVREEMTRGIHLYQLEVAIVPRHEKHTEKLFKNILQICESVGEEKYTPVVKTLFSEEQDIAQVERSSFLNKDWWQAAEEGKQVLPREFYI